MLNKHKSQRHIFLSLFYVFMPLSFRDAPIGFGSLFALLLKTEAAVKKIEDSSSPVSFAASLRALLSFEDSPRRRRQQLFLNARDSVLFLSSSSVLIGPCIFVTVMKLRRIRHPKWQKETISRSSRLWIRFCWTHIRPDGDDSYWVALRAVWHPQPLLASKAQVGHS